MATTSPDNDDVQRAVLYRLHDDVERYERRTMLVVSAAVLLIGLCLPMFIVEVNGYGREPRVGWLPEITSANGWAVVVLLIGFGLIVSTFVAAIAPSRRLLLGCAIGAGALLIVTLLVAAGVGIPEPTGRDGEVAYSITLGLCPMVAGAILTVVSAVRARSVIEA